MDPIVQGAFGAAVSDIQNRLVKLGFEIDESELADQVFGSTTLNAVFSFRVQKNLPVVPSVDDACWEELVDATYELGDRTLYLRLPNFHGKDVEVLQTRLNILGFSCGECDGYFGVHTEAAVKQFQENVGLLADGMLFLDTYRALERLRHVWSGSQANGPHPASAIGFARAAHVLETVALTLDAKDPIARNIAGRIYNLAHATVEGAKVYLCDDTSCPRDVPFFELASSPFDGQEKVANVTVEEFETLPMRLKTAYESLKNKEVTVIRLELPSFDTDTCKFTMSDAQTFAVMLLDAICAAFDEN